ncbi:Protein GET1 [Rhizoctonia solani]|uniref:Protein GET1 n=1 Tax=Rhizoctonia solani TaxID=456999 RepID=A0A8H7M1E3_9AGAM|nr:Protein GET1 [Rhizoctonia solani]
MYWLLSAIYYKLHHKINLPSGQVAKESGQRSCGIGYNQLDPRIGKNIFLCQVQYGFVGMYNWGAVFHRMVYGRSAVFYLPPGWMGPATWWLSLPFAPRGSVSCGVWQMACQRVLRIIERLVRDAFVKHENPSILVEDHDSTSASPSPSPRAEKPSSSFDDTPGKQHICR